MILIVALIVFIMAIGITGKSSKDNTLPSRKIDLTQEMVDGLTSVIQLKGFHCPEVKLAYQRDPDAYGDNSKVWCGPKGSDDVYEKAVFRVTITPKLFARQCFNNSTYSSSDSFVSEKRLIRGLLISSFISGLINVSRSLY